MYTCMCLYVYVCERVMQARTRALTAARGVRIGRNVRGRALDTVSEVRGASVPSKFGGSRDQICTTCGP